MLTAVELGLLARLDLVHRRPASGHYSGQRRSPRTARSPEFADFRAYVPGDDFRQVDWRAYARLERLMLRLYVAEEEACLNVVVDDSASMVVGSEPGESTKLAAARRLGAALTFLGAAAMDRVTVGALSGRSLRPLRGRDALGRVLPFLESVEAGPASGPDELARAAWARPGLTVVLSDFLAADAEGVAADWAPAFAALGRRRQEVVAWQLLAAGEETPSLTGDVKLLDAESERRLEMTVTASVLAGYEEALAELRDRLRRAAIAAGGRFLASPAAGTVESWMGDGLRAGLVKRA